MKTHIALSQPLIRAAVSKHDPQDRCYQQICGTDTFNKLSNEQKDEIDREIQKHKANR